MSGIKTAVVTGANRGIGLEIARQLAKDHGFQVVLTGRTKEKAETAAAKLRAEGLEAQGAALDVTDEKDALALAAALKKAGDDVQVLVNNAGIFPGDRSAALEESSEALIEGFRTNTLGPFQVTKAFAPLLKKSGRGRVVMVSSGMGQLSEMGSGAPGYRVSKAGVNALARIFSNELESDGVKVNTICPGWVKTDMGGKNATRDVSKGAASAVWAATLDDDGPTGGFFRDGKRLDW